MCFSGLCLASVGSLGDNEEVANQVHVSSEPRKGSWKAQTQGVRTWEAFYPNDGQEKKMKIHILREKGKP